MDHNALINGLIGYVYLIIIITFHEFGHAWMASRCGDDTARLQGRVTLNPAAHMDLLGTVVLPLISVLLTAAGSGMSRFIIGWGKPVPVNVYQLRNRNRDDLLVAMAGPFMNVLLALAAMAAARVGVMLGQGTDGGVGSMIQEIGFGMTIMSMGLCFFNLLPIPPLDGSYLLRHLTRMPHETFLKLSQYGFILVLFVIQIPMVRSWISGATLGSFTLMLHLFRFPVVTGY